MIVNDHNKMYILCQAFSLKFFNFLFSQAKVGEKQKNFFENEDNSSIFFKILSKMGKLLRS